MAWGTPLTAVSNSSLTAAQWNASVRDNLLETAPAKATTAGRLIVTTGANAIAERAVETNTVTTGQSTSSLASFGDLTTVGPSVTVTTGTKAIVFASAQIENSTAGGGGLVGVAVSGATTIGAVTVLRQTSSSASERATCTGHYTFSAATTPLNAGSNTFKLQYTTPTGGTATFTNRLITVIAL